MIRVDTSALGTVNDIYVNEGQILFGGYFGELGFDETGSQNLYAESPFIWDSNSNPRELSQPEGGFFSSISAVYMTENGDTYLAGVFSKPVYWENEELVLLESKYGSVSQFLEHEGDIYAVGQFNKENSNSTGFTACYWKNGARIDLEEDAQAHGIFIDGEDIYVSGSVGRVPVDYKACYWKNGERFDLPE